MEKFNHSPKWLDSAGRVNPEPGLLKNFKGMEFVCKNASNFTPKDNPAGIKAFNALVEYVSSGDQMDGFWYDSGNKQRREQLLSAAIKEKSWKAVYVNSIWSLKYPSSETPASVASDDLRELVSQGIPIAAYKYATYLFGRDGDTMYSLLAEAIKRGSPQAMTLVGGTIIVRAQELHPLGKQLLECAAAQGYAEAYYHLGIFADMDGRRLDAYRLWEKGVNRGCSGCITPLSNLAKVRRGYKVNVPMMELMPELTAIGKFYENNFFFLLTELPDFYRKLPNDLVFNISDNELLKLLKLEKRSRM